MTWKSFQYLMGSEFVGSNNGVTLTGGAGLSCLFAGTGETTLQCLEGLLGLCPWQSGVLSALE